MAVRQEHVVSVQVEAFQDQFTVEEMIALGEELAQAVEIGLDPGEFVDFTVDGQSGRVKEIATVGELPLPEPKKPAKKAARKRPAKKATPLPTDG